MKKNGLFILIDITLYLLFLVILSILFDTFSRSINLSGENRAFLIIPYFWYILASIIFSFIHVGSSFSFKENIIKYIYIKKRLLIIQFSVTFVPILLLFITSDFFMQWLLCIGLYSFFSILFYVFVIEKIGRKFGF